MLYFVTSELL